MRNKLQDCKKINVQKQDSSNHKILTTYVSWRISFPCRKTFYFYVNMKILLHSSNSNESMAYVCI